MNTYKAYCRANGIARLFLLLSSITPYFCLFVFVVAITNQGKISVLDFEVFEDEDGHYIEYGSTYEKIYIDDVQEDFN